MTPSARSRQGLNLFDVNGTLLAASASASITSVSFVGSHFVVLGAVALLTGHADGVVRLHRLDASVDCGVQLGVEMGEPLPKPASGDKAASLPFVLQEIYAYTAHVGQCVTALCVLPDGLVSADDKGKLVRAVSKDRDAVEVRVEI